MAVKTHNIGFQMNWKEHTKTFKKVLNWKKIFGLHGLFKKNPSLEG